MAYDFRLGRDEKREILRIARATAEEFLRSGRVPPGRPHRRSLLAGAGAFVTLRRRGGELRGCVGTQSEEQPLYRTVQEMVVAAATRDPRFPPVRDEEIAGLVIEVSVLGEHAPVRHAGEIEIGVHGVAVSCRGKRGLLLPQVAQEGGWTAEELLARVCGKAELPDDAWQLPDVAVERFTAQVFDEVEFPPLDPQEILAQLARGS
ncbi:MAG TPA: AmmeMemoRadiSam system protein A [Kofleriaceae bacterium]|nr:AmmeMemoRadiSam system protein A [Kofleriaceae bacterium]